MKIQKGKLIKISILIAVIMLLVTTIIVFNKTGLTRIATERIRSILQATGETQETETKAEYEIESKEGEYLFICITLENPRGIEKITTSDVEIKANGKTKIALDRILQEGEEYQVNVKLVGEETEETYKLLATTKPIIEITNIDTFDDGTTRSVEITYPNNSEITNLYSIDNGATWETYTDILNLPIETTEKVIAKTEYTSCKTIQNKNIQELEIKADSLMEYIGAEIQTTGTYTKLIKDVTYSIHAIVNEGDLNISTDTQIGDASDVGTASANAKNMVLLKVNGNLTVDAGATLTAYGDTYGGPKGFFIYVTGDITNNGTIHMTGKGAKAVGENVYIWQNISKDKKYEYVPANGGNGGGMVYSEMQSSSTNGTNGYNGINRQTGGGGAGGASGASMGKRREAYSGDGTRGTAYSGGTGGGAASAQAVSSGDPRIVGISGSNYGGAGGPGVYTDSLNAGGSGRRCWKSRRIRK